MQELKGMKIWLCWNYTAVNGRKTKKPISAYGTATGTDAAHAHTLVTYNEAVSAAEKNNFDGVGFVIPEGYFFLDIDHKDLTDSFVQLLLKRFDSYTERSVSKEGIHIYGKYDPAKLPTYTDKNGNARLNKDFYTKNPNNNVELYLGGITNRFAVYTEDAIYNVPIRDCTVAVLTTLDKDMRRKPKVKYSEQRDGNKEIFDIVCTLRKQKNGDKFCKLYDRGDYSEYGSHSEADAALCALIAFRTGPDNAAIDEIFRTSALYREKWEREDYRDATIQAGIAACNGQFHRSKMEHPYFIKFNDETGQPHISIPLLAKYVREHLPYVLVRDSGKQAVLRFC